MLSKLFAAALFTALTLAAGCAGSDSTNTPPPTSEPPPTPRPTSTPLPDAAVAEVAEFAAACGQLEMAYDGTAESFDEWMAGAQVLKAPPVAVDWWTAYVDQFALQDENGSNAQTQHARERMIDALVVMDSKLQEVLVDAGCMDESEAEAARETPNAWARLRGGLGQAEGATLDEFIQACVDIGTTAPMMGSQDQIIQHLVHWWDRLVPTPALERYHAAAADFYEAMAKVEDPGDIDPSVSQEVTTAASALDADVFKRLKQSGCIGD